MKSGCGRIVVLVEGSGFSRGLLGKKGGALTLLDAGGGGIRPPYHTFVIPRKKLMGKVANFFLLFLNM